jgi:acyl-CoA thioesterase-1
MGGRMKWLPGRMWLRAGLLIGSLWLMSLAHAAGPASGPILVVGDSLSAAHNIPLQSGWVSLLEQRLKREITVPPVVVNASISGETTAGALTRLPALLKKHRPALVVIELGGNDALRGLSPLQLQKNLEKLLQLSLQNESRVLLLGIEVPPNYGQAYRERVRRSYAELAAQYQVELVPFLLDGVALTPGLMQADGIHPTAEAQPKVLDNVWPALRRALKK